MAKNLKVKCTVNRYWDPKMHMYLGDEIFGTLVDFSTQSDDSTSNKILPVGIVLLDKDGTFESVPLEFMEFIDECSCW